MRPVPFLLTAVCIALAPLRPAAAQEPPRGAALADSLLDGALPAETAPGLAALLIGSGDDPELRDPLYRGTDGVAVVIDGLPAEGRAGAGLAGGALARVPAAALAAMRTPTGFVRPRWGGFGAIVEADTRTRPAGRVGHLDGAASAGLDPYGAARTELALGGGVGPLQAFGAATYTRADDLDPRSYAAPTLSPETLADLRARPTALVARDGDGLGRVVPLDASVVGRTVASVAQEFGLDPDAVFVGLLRPNVVTDIETSDVKPGSDGADLRLHGGLALAPTPASELRATVQGLSRDAGAFDPALSLFAPDAMPRLRDDAWRGALTGRAALGAGVELSGGVALDRAQRIRHDPRFAADGSDLLRYGDADDPANAVAAQAVEERSGEDGDVIVLRARDGRVDLRALQGLLPLVPEPGYAREEAGTRLAHLALSARLGAWRVELGADARDRTERGYAVSGGVARELARSVDDGDVERPLDLDGDGVADGGVTRLGELPYGVFPVDNGGTNTFGSALAYGYTFDGRRSDATVTRDGVFRRGGVDALPISEVAFDPLRGTRRAAFAELDGAVGHLELRGGVRVERFATNAVGLFDPFATIPVVRVRDFDDLDDGLQAPDAVPDGVGDDFAAYFLPSGVVAGYRSLDGRYVDADGVETTAEALRIQGASPTSTGDVFGVELAPSQARVVVLPRAEAALRLGPARVAVFGNAYARAPELRLSVPTLAQTRAAAESQIFLPNAALAPERVTELGLDVQAELELGRVATMLGATAWTRRYRDLVRPVLQRDVFPTSYETAANATGSRVWGIDVRSAGALGRLSWVGRAGVAREPYLTERVPTVPAEVPSTPFVDFDDTVELTVPSWDASLAAALRLRPEDGPALGGLRPLGGLSVGVVARAASGDAYTRSSGELFSIAEPGFFLSSYTGARGGERTSRRSRIDVRVARTFRVGAAARLEALMWVENVLGTTTVLRVSPVTGEPDVDGYLAAEPDRIANLPSREQREAFAAQYRARVRDPLNVGRPRQLRLGLRLGW